MRISDMSPGWIWTHDKGFMRWFSLGFVQDDSGVQSIINCKNGKLLKESYFPGGLLISMSIRSGAWVTTKKRSSDIDVLRKY